MLIAATNLPASLMALFLLCSYCQMFLGTSKSSKFSKNRYIEANILFDIYDTTGNFRESPAGRVPGGVRTLDFYIRQQGAGAGVVVLWTVAAGCCPSLFWFPTLNAGLLP